MKVPFLVFGWLAIIVGGLSMIVSPGGGDVLIFGGICVAAGTILGVMEQSLAVQKHVTEQIVSIGKMLDSKLPDPWAHCFCEHCYGKLRCTPNQIGTTVNCAHCGENTTVRP